MGDRCEFDSGDGGSSRDAVAGIRPDGPGSDLMAAVLQATRHAGLRPPTATLHRIANEFGTILPCGMGS